MSKKIGKKEKREIGFLLLGALIGLFFGLITNLFVSSLFELLHLTIDEPWEMLFIVLVLFITSTVLLFVFARKFKRMIEKALPELGK